MAWLIALSVALAAMSGLCGYLYRRVRTLQGEVEALKEITQLHTIFDSGVIEFIRGLNRGLSDDGASGEVRH